MSNNRWYKEVLKKYIGKIISSAMTYIVLVFIFLLWHFILGIKFQWQDITTLSQPTIFVRSFYSAFVFGTIGAFLYFIHFYELLKYIVVKKFRLLELYKIIKAVLWAYLIYISYMYIVPGIFKILNIGMSFLFNIANLVLYLLPPIGIALVIVYLMIKNNKKINETNT